LYHLDASAQTGGRYPRALEVSKERGPESYKNMGHGSDPGKHDYTVVVAVREMLQNSLDAGATEVDILLLLPEGGAAFPCTLAVKDNAPDRYENGRQARMDLKKFRSVYINNETSSKGPGESSGGKGQAREYMKSFDGLFIAGADGLQAVCMRPNVFSRDDRSKGGGLDMDPSIVPKDANEIRELFDVAPKLDPATDDGSLFAIQFPAAADAGGATLLADLAYYLARSRFDKTVRARCAVGAGQSKPLALPKVSQPINENPAIVNVPIYYDGKHINNLTYSLWLLPMDESAPVSSALLPPTRARLHVVGVHGILMFSKDYEVQNLNNAAHYEVLVSVRLTTVSGSTRQYAASALFNLPRNDFQIFSDAVLDGPTLLRRTAENFRKELQTSVDEVVVRAVSDKAAESIVPQSLLPLIKTAADEAGAAAAAAAPAGGNAQAIHFETESRLDPRSASTETEEVRTERYCPSAVFDGIPKQTKIGVDNASLVAYCWVVGTFVRQTLSTADFQTWTRGPGSLAKERGREVFSRMPEFWLLFQSENIKNVDVFQAYGRTSRKLNCIQMNTEIVRRKYAGQETFRALASLRRTVIHEMCHYYVSMYHDIDFWECAYTVSTSPDFIDRVNELHAILGLEEFQPFELTVAKLMDTFYPLTEEELTEIEEKRWRRTV